MKAFTHEEVIKRLKELERRWPKDLWLFAGDAALCLLEKKDGQRVMNPHPGMGTAYDPNASIATFPKIEAEGGGF